MHRASLEHLEMLSKQRMERMSDLGQT
jgi:predicted amidohydrolase YtcJ